MGDWMGVKSSFLSQKLAESEGHGWLEEGLREIGDRVRGECYCLLENYGPRRLSQQ